MQSYNEWKKNIDEGRSFRQKGPPGGAFGKQRSLASQGIVNTDVPRIAGDYNHTRDQHQKQGYNQRIAFGLTQEPKIISAAKACDIEIIRATSEQDKFGGIDGWWKVNDQLIPIQIKYRDSGNDIGFEILNPVVGFPLISSQNKLGRDFKFANQYVNFGTNGPRTPNTAFGKGAEYIIHLNPDGKKLTIIPTKPCYEIIFNMLKQVDEEGKWRNNQSRNLTTSKGTLLWKVDKSNGVKKVLAYIPINAIGFTKQCDVNINIE